MATDRAHEWIQGPANTLEFLETVRRSTPKHFGQHPAEQDALLFLTYRQLSSFQSASREVGLGNFSIGAVDVHVLNKLPSFLFTM